MAHKLIIDIQDSTNDSRYIHVRDYSIWDSVLQVKDRLFQILPPYSDQYRIVPFPENSLLSVSGPHIGLDLDQDIPDGAYNYHYSVSPNATVNVSGCHYRVANMLNKVFGKMMVTSVGSVEGMDDCGNVEIDKQHNVLIHIWSLLESAASAGRHTHLKARADELYQMAVREFNKLFESPCSSC